MGAHAGGGCRRSSPGGSPQAGGAAGLQQKHLCGCALHLCIVGQICGKKTGHFGPECGHRRRSPQHREPTHPRNHPPCPAGCWTTTGSCTCRSCRRQCGPTRTSCSSPPRTRPASTPAARRSAGGRRSACDSSARTSPSSPSCCTRLLQPQGAAVLVSAVPDVPHPAARTHSTGALPPPQGLPLPLPGAARGGHPRRGAGHHPGEEVGRRGERPCAPSVCLPLAVCAGRRLYAPLAVPAGPPSAASRVSGQGTTRAVQMLMAIAVVPCAGAASRPATPPSWWR